MTGRLDLGTWIAARPEAVFGVLHRPDGLASWMDFGANGVALGEVTAIERPGRFAFTWGYESGKPFPAAGRGSCSATQGLTEEASRGEGWFSSQPVNAHCR